MRYLLCLALLLIPFSASADCLPLAIGQNWTFYAQTSRFSTGAAYDAASAPTYRVYEDENDTPILTGTMAIFDDDDTIGLYSEQIAVSTGNGFEVGKCYLIRKTATVDSIVAAATDCACVPYRTDTSGYIADASGVAIPHQSGDVYGVATDIRTKTNNLTFTGTDVVATLDGESVAVNTLQSTAVADLFDRNSGETYSTAVAGSVVKEIADNASATNIAAIKAKTDSLPASPAAVGSAMTLTSGERGSIADSVWDEAQSGHTTSGTFGKYLDQQVSTVGGGSASAIADAVWDELTSGHTTAGSFGNKLNSATVTTTSPVNSAGTAISLVQGDDYKNADGTQLSFSSSSWSISGHTVKLHLVPIANDTTTALTITCTVSSATAAYCELTAAQTAALSVGQYSHALRVTRTSATVSTLLVGGRTTVVKTPNP